MFDAPPLPPPAVLPRIAAFADEIVAIRHDIHAHPEIGFEEVRTSALVADKLASWGIAVQCGIGGTGVVGRLEGRRGPGRTIGLRADMDALPMPEETGLAYASVHPGRFHGCGHDAHTAILLGAARYLAETRDFAGTVIFIFQPAEEGLGGARAMIADGLFDRFPADELYGLHNTSQAPAHQLNVSAATRMAGADFFDITLKGQGAHGAHPENARDPIPAVAALIQALQTVVSRNVKPTEAAVVSVTKVESGSAYNVIPETARIGGTVRAFSDEVRAAIRERIRGLAAGIAAAHDLTAEIDIRDSFSVLVNHAGPAEVVAAVGREVLGAARVVTEPRQIMGSEDFADLLKHAPGVFFTVGHAGGVAAHNPRFLIDDALLPVAATLFARIVETRLALGQG